MAGRRAHSVYLELATVAITTAMALALAGSASAQTITLCGGNSEVFGENQSLLLPLEQPDLGRVVTTRVTVDLAIEHHWVGDLWVILNHADKNVELLQRPGQPASLHGCGGDNVNVTLRDDAALPAEDACSLSPPAIAGSLSPIGMLADFVGDDPAGFWTLAIFDLGADDCGVVPPDGVCVHITYAPDCNGNGIPDDNDILIGNSRDDNDNQIPDECEVLGECDFDGDIDLIDYTCYVVCRSGPAGGVTPECHAFDFDGDGDIDLMDFGVFQSEFTGPLP